MLFENEHLSNRAKGKSIEKRSRHIKRNTHTHIHERIQMPYTDMNKKKVWYKLITSY